MTVNGRWREAAGTTFETYKKEAVASRGMVTSNHPMASAAGVQMLAMGGNAIDAAIATAFALTVVEPAMVGIFGAGFVNMYDAATGESITIDNYAVAPSKAAPDMYTPVSDTWPDYLETVDMKNRMGHLSVGVPGALKSWCYVEDTYGRLGLEAVIQPAIGYAERGFPASQYLIDLISNNAKTLSRFKATAEIFLPGGGPPKLGMPIVRGDYSKTLRLISQKGSDALYGGELGRTVVEDIKGNGGILSMDDLLGYQIKQREPVRGTFREYEIVSVAPTSSGGTHIIQVLNILEELDLASLGYGTARYLHLLAEALKIAFADRFEYMGDPDLIEVPVEGLISKEYAALRRQEIDRGHAKDYMAGRPMVYAGESANTTHLTTADADGSMVAMTQTIHSGFGSQVTVPGTGMLLNNTMYLFDPHPGHPNSVAPGKRMLSSMSPTMVLKKGKPFMALGTPGSTRIFAAVLQAILNVVEHGMTLQEAVEAPRIWTQGQELNVEEGVPPSVRDELAAMGHKIEVVPRVAGGMNGIMLDEDTGMLHGAACWRADGSPVGIGGGWARPGMVPRSSV